MDEIRVSKVLRSISWIKTEYNNQSDVNNFMTFGTVESCQAPYRMGGKVKFQGTIKFR